MSKIESKLKDGSTVTLYGNETFIIKGVVDYSHINSFYTEDEIRSLNHLWDNWKGKGPGPRYRENVNIPFVKLSVSNASIISKHEKLTDAERFVKDHFFESLNSPGISRFSFKAYRPVQTSVMIDNMIVDCDFKDELALGSVVICKGRVCIGTYGTPVIRLTEVTTIGEPRYLDRSKYNKKANAA